MRKHVLVAQEPIGEVKFETDTPTTKDTQRNGGSQVDIECIKRFAMKDGTTSGRMA